MMEVILCPYYIFPTHYQFGRLFLDWAHPEKSMWNSGVIKKKNSCTGLVNLYRTAAAFCIVEDHGVCSEVCLVRPVLVLRCRTQRADEISPLLVAATQPWSHTCVQFTRVSTAPAQTLSCLQKLHVCVRWKPPWRWGGLSETERISVWGMFGFLSFWKGRSSDVILRVKLLWLGIPSLV